MKKLSKKKWKEHFENAENWKVCTKLPTFGMQITRLTGTEIFALEKWFDFGPQYRINNSKGHWSQCFFFYLEEDENLNAVPRDITKTTALECLYRGEHVKQRDGQTC